MTEKTYTVCTCGRKYRSDGAYAKEVCGWCLPAYKNWPLTPDQVAARNAPHKAWRGELVETEAA